MSVDSNTITNLEQFQGTTIRREIIDGEPWFVAKDICEVLDIKNNRHATSKLPDKWVKDDVVFSDITGRKQGFTAINEAGVYRLVIRSNKPVALKFQEWLCEQVIPSIRKTGYYAVQTERIKVKRLDWELDREVADYFSWSFTEDAIVKSRMTDYMVEKYLPLPPNKRVANDQPSSHLIFDLSEILSQMGFKPYQINLQSLGKYIAKRYREHYNKEPKTTMKACNGSYRPCKAYTIEESVLVKQWINEYRNAESNSSNSSNSSSIAKVIDDVLIDMNDNKKA